MSLPVAWVVGWLLGGVWGYIFGWYGHQRWQWFQINRKLDAAEKRRRS